MGGLAELILVAGPVLAFAIYELVTLRRDKNRAAAETPAEGKRPEKSI